MRPSVAGPIADAFVVKHERAAVAGWPRGIKTVVLMHRDVIPARHLTPPVVVAANAVGVGCIERLNQILAHQVSAVIGATEAFKRTVFQSDWLKLCNNRLAQLAAGRAVREIANHNHSSSESDDDERDVDRRSFHDMPRERSSKISFQGPRNDAQESFA